MSLSCCCNWGAASARKDSGEWPEFECRDCPEHRQGLGPVDEQCRRHRQDPEARARRTSDLNARSDALIDDLVALERELSS